jgi:hypothetical protein
MACRHCASSRMPSLEIAPKRPSTSRWAWCQSTPRLLQYALDTHHHFQACEHPVKQANRFCTKGASCRCAGQFCVRYHRGLSRPQDSYRVVQETKRISRIWCRPAPWSHCWRRWAWKTRSWQRPARVRFVQSCSTCRCRATTSLMFAFARIVCVNSCEGEVRACIDPDALWHSAADAAAGGTGRIRHCPLL